jgi:F-type H+-transporting ATPase subunit epsilon
MATTIRVEVVSAEAAIYSGEATMVVATGDQGELGITPRHAPLITRLKPGKVVVTEAGGEKVDISITGGGILEVQPHAVTVLADTAVRSEEIDEAAALAAKKEAEDALANRSDAIDVAEAQAKLVAALTQLQALERLRKNLKH